MSYIQDDCWKLIKEYLINPLIPFHYIKSQPIMVTIDNNNVIKKMTRHEYDTGNFNTALFVRIIREIYYLDNATNLVITKYQNEDTQNIIKTTYKLVNPDYKITEINRHQKLKFWCVRNSFNNKHLYSKKDWCFELKLRFICYRQQQKQLTSLNTLTKFLVDNGQIHTSNSVKQILKISK
jgi:hypothetical protein